MCLKMPFSCTNLTECLAFCHDGPLICLHPSPRVQNPGTLSFLSCTSVRIPTLRAHSEAVTIETEKPVSTEAARKVLIPPTTKVISFYILMISLTPSL